MATYYRIKRLDGKTETFMNRRAVEEVVPVSESDWQAILDGKTVKVASFMGQVEIKMVVTRGKRK